MGWIISMCRKQLRDLFNSKALHETFMQILNTFMSTGSPHSWVKYMMPEAIESHTTTSSSADPVPSDTIGLDQLMAEARAVLTRYICNVLDSMINNNLP